MAMIAKPSSAPASNARTARGCGFTRLHLPLVAVLAAGWGGGTVAAAAAPPDPSQCDKSACAGNYHPYYYDYCLLHVGDRIVCDDEQFPHPALVERSGFNENFIYYTCCKADDGSLLAAGLPVSGSLTPGALQCDASGYIRVGFEFPEPMVCDDEQFRHPVLVERYDDNGIRYTCCKVDDGSLLAAGLPVSRGGFIRNKGFYLATISLLVISAASAFLSSLLLASILAFPRSRSDPFNLYIVFLAIPDWMMNIYYLIAQAMILADVSPREFQGHFFTIIFSMYFFLNVLINGIIGYEVNKMVARSHQRIGTDPPTIKQVLVQCFWVYVFGAVAGFLLGDQDPDVVLIGLPFMTVLFLYLVYALCRIWKTGTLKLTGRTKRLTIYFGRIILVFVLFLVPGFVFYYLEAVGIADYSAYTIAQCVMSLQGAVVALLMITTNDEIRKSAKRTIGLEWLAEREKNRWVEKVEKEEGWKLKDAPDRIGKDPDVVKAAIANSPSDPTVVSFAVKQTGWALEYATEAMKNDKPLVLRAVEKCGDALKHASDDLRANDDVIIAAVQQQPTSLQFALGGKNQSKNFLKEAGLFDDITEYEADKLRLVLSTRFSLGETTSATATIFALYLKQHPYIRQSFNLYFPNSYDKRTCDPEWTDIQHPCRGTFQTCQMDDELKTGVPREKESCWRYSYRYQLERGEAMIQVMEYYYAGEKQGGSGEVSQVAGHVLGNGQNIETEMAASVGRKVFRCFQPVNEEGEREEFDASTIHDVATEVEKWYEEDPTNLEECNLRWRWGALGKFWLQKED